MDIVGSLCARSSSSSRTNEWRTRAPASSYVIYPHSRARTSHTTLHTTRTRECVCVCNIYCTDIFVYITSNYYMLSRLRTPRYYAIFRKRASRVMLMMEHGNVLVLFWANEARRFPFLVCLPIAAAALEKNTYAHQCTTSIWRRWRRPTMTIMMMTTMTTTTTKANVWGAERMRKIITYSLKCTYIYIYIKICTRFLTPQQTHRNTTHYILYILYMQPRTGGGAVQNVQQQHNMSFACRRACFNLCLYINGYEYV